MNLPQIDDYERLFITESKLLDTRSPIEYGRGSFPNACNIALLSDEQRQQIGTCYKNYGKNEAIKLGYELINEGKKQQIIEQWRQFITANPNGALYCFRGGLRSQIAQEWIYQNSGIVYPRIKGGYKAMRRFLVEHPVANSISLLILAGATGAGKTRLIKKLPKSIDLERLANHRGSAFGRHIAEQPRQIDFENSLIIELLKKQKHQIVVEDESKNIGSVRIHDQFYLNMQGAKVVLLQTDFNTRVKNTVDEYVLAMLEQNITAFGDDLGVLKFSEYFLQSLAKIKKRLGGKLYQDLKSKTCKAIAKYQQLGEVNDFYIIVEALLSKYYDPMYQYQIKSKQQRIVFQGDEEAVLQYLE